VRRCYHDEAFEDAVNSSAYNVDYTYFRWWSCYQGDETWLNQFERGRDYAAGDAWGCVGLWFSGRWYFNNADYLAAVDEYLDDRIWETPPFINYTG
jgi:autotransporter family porin